MTIDTRVCSCDDTDAVVGVLRAVSVLIPTVIAFLMDKFSRDSPDGTTLFLPLFSILFLQNRKVLIASKYF